VFVGDFCLYPRLTGRQTVHFLAALHGVSAGDRRRVAARLLDRVGLVDWADERVEQYSRGMRQRLHLARGLVGDPALLLLDEPTAGMDPAAALEFRVLVDELRREGRTVLVTTHNMVEAEQVCDRVTLIDRGTILATERPATLTDQVAFTDRIEAEGVPVELQRRLAADDDVRLLGPATDGSIRLEVRPAVTTAILRQLLDADVVKVRVSKPSLEEAYLVLTRDSGLRITR
jgi:ABC-2 type transport system ATP-binding protein